MKRFIKVLAVSLLLLSLYNFAGTSDQVDWLTIEQQQQVMARQYEVVPRLGR